MRDDGLLAGRVILITGAGGGLGGAVARAAAAAGAELILSGRDQKRLATVYDAVVAESGREPALFPMDFTGAAEADYERLADGIAADFGRLDGIAHLAAAFAGLQPLASTSLEEWQRTLHATLTAPFAITRTCLPLLQATEDAAVVFATDGHAAPGPAFWGPYAAAKAGLETMANMLAAEAGDGLRVHTVDPGPLNTALRRRAYPGGAPEAAAPDEAAADIVRLLSPGE
jgi:NAD(P)-dependent dehydrogenase (short-subunit alcohol dehydrogenase family)